MSASNSSYQFRDPEVMREAGDVANSAHMSSSPGFTAINQPSPHLSSPCQPVATSQLQQITTKARTTDKLHRRRNPAVASYLGLGDSTEPAHLVKYAPTPDGRSSSAKPIRKRRVARGSHKAPAMKTIHTDSSGAPNLRHSSEIGYVTKNRNQPIICESTESHLVAPAPMSLANAQEEQLHNIAMHTKDTPHLQRFHVNAEMSTVYNDDDDFGQLCFDFEPGTHTVEQSPCQTSKSELMQLVPVQTDDDEFDDDLMDVDLVDVSQELMDVSSCPDIQSSSFLEIPFSQQKNTPDTSAIRPMSPDERLGGSGSSSKSFVSPVTMTTRLLAVANKEARKPHVRPTFPAALRERSPIIGMSSNSLLRTCFRIGEAINQSCQAVTTGNNILIELYARVLNSERDNLQQRFTFCDLFHVKLPHIQATYAAAIWKSVRLFEYDSARLLQPGRICRCIGTLKRNGKEWTMSVLNIWEATWDDIEWVMGIIEA
ncbi:hypothetical protein OPT61_g2457 [Boeremia exigua]|uniref:Uncharacterized protein n=1 Tax=Boeremia exigua TaxID=749465 RepID=A0ACC2ILI2_9PLEO|nr:hypothetical protein OPT61_g2457 [Boeremia exigua]